MVKFSTSQNENLPDQAHETQIAKQIDANNVDTAASEKGSVSAVPAVQVEAVTKSLKEFQSCLKEGKYEQAWELTSEYFKQNVCNGSLEKFKEVCDMIGLATVTVHPESAVINNDQVGLLITGPSLKEDLYLFFIEEDGQWRLYIGQEARDVPR
jgi:hypothetical protein